MATIKGQNLRLFMENGSGQMSAIAAAQQCQLNIRLEVQQSSTKDDTDDFARNIALKLSWSMSANGVVTIDPDRNDPASLINRVGQTVRVELSTAGGDMNSDAVEQLLVGDAILNDVQIEATNEEESTYSIQLTGRKNALTDIRALMSADEHYLVSANGSKLFAAHEPTE